MGSLLDCIFYIESEDEVGPLEVGPPVRILGWPFQSLATAGDSVKSQPNKLL
jgi:hypothetical protein